MPGDSGVLVVTRVRFTTSKCTRGCGCSGHPAFPTPSLGREIKATPRAHRAARTKSYAKLYQRHCERSEAIHSFFSPRDGLLRFARNDGVAVRQSNPLSSSRRRPGPITTGACRKYDEGVACENSRYQPLRFPTIGGTFDVRLACRQERTLEETFMAATRIDCDIHPAVGGTRTTLLPYLDDHWKEQVVSRAIDGLDLNSYPPNMPLSGPRRLAARERQAGLRTRDGAARRVRSARRQPRHLQCALWRAGRVRSLYGLRLLQGDQRLDRGRVARARFASARVDRGADAGA